MPSSGRIDKRKRRRPTRSLSLADVKPEFCTLRMSFLDDYQRNPSAYSRALLGSRYSAPPLPSSSSSSPSNPHSLSSSPLPLAPFNLSRPRQPRKSISAAIRRLFPSLDDPEICEMAASKVPIYPPSRQHSPSPTPPSALPADSSQFITDDLSHEIFHMRPNVTTCSVKWAKAAPMDVTEYAMAEHLAPAERECCSILRLYPEQYLAIKQALVRAGRTMAPGTFKKRDAQKLCRVDVNKTSKVFEWFCKLGWIPQASSKSYE
ncbi:hypothetical protein LPJ78_003272 [Coemansia sp. RSA 989]|nr:Homeodomain-like protein [Coemansia mojavensis]KAJ1738140.1 hypothetical protein LPJ68_005798 [Coemansia sp. RSA 1086]KAJ1748708.1 hypothetical protein LPJ79_004299 [Coemansia sp. RSA 1821]KAJ1864617.1 hypothetical protein LPJ78_003272 [Coemansia sp. RSA 989]KAJ1872027.1 hypothetical protein LPJ55_003400 [Coemansia sp. RSA 990]KAJ2629187.1 hypothetical protein H4R22_003470 [Coemansia sp. RSA 1290]KAJ2647295.1 hypothetical protein IWW40_004770 [Coemansia sp. RSA 1250]KAJ2670963.1 hypotheti